MTKNTRKTARGNWPALSTALLLCLAIRGADAAGVAIVLAIDVSASVTPGAYILQRDGIARAFEDRDLSAAVMALPDGIEALVLEWSDPEAIAVTVPWTRIVDRSSALRFAAAARGTTRSSRGLTAIGPALAAAAEQFMQPPEPAARRIIDLSGDGVANLGEPPRQVRDRLVAEGITINALAITGAPPWLSDYYRRNVIGGAGAFVLAAADFKNFAEAILKKLATEIAHPHPSFPREQGRLRRGLAQMQ